MTRAKSSKSSSETTMTPRRSTRSKRPVGDVVPDVYKELLLEAAKSSPLKSDEESRAVKRRRVGERVSKTSRGSGVPAVDEPQAGSIQDNLNDLFEGLEDEKQLQTVYDDFMGSDDGDEETEEEDDDDFEDVDLNIPGPTKADEAGEVNISLKPVKPEMSLAAPRRKAVGAAERKFRLDVHKAHLLCLLAHLRCRNEWCNNLEVQSHVKPLLSRQTINLLHEDESESQFQRNHSWMKGIEACCEVFKDHFEVDAPGLRRAFWKEEADLSSKSNIYDENGLIDKDDFIESARRKLGSRDVGAQLLCALLRSVAVDARLVFSLQTLPFSGVAKGTTPEKPKPSYIYAKSPQSHRVADDGDTIRADTDYSNPRRRIGQPQFDSPSKPIPARPVVPKKKKIVDSPYPIFWVEAFNEASQRWIPLDPLVRNTINKPKTGFEPPANDRLNQMSYVIAFEEDGTARDVTLRYARHYNAKTRKTRVESTKGGVQWWKRVMSSLEKAISEDRDEIEDAELAAREAAEEMPRNVQDFKDHPRYALERHLRRNEAIWPMQEVGKISPGMGKDAKLESIYRRNDVHTVRSADQWYRKGRDVKVGEQPLKRVVPKRKRGVNVDDMDEDDEDLQDGTRLYAEFQTNIYVPPPIVKGRVPKNVYGNIDVYVPSMIPPGGVHIQHPETARAAKTLGIDYADAVTGFEFKGRQGTAVVKGIIVATEYQEAVVEVLRNYNDSRARAIEQAKTIEALTLWKRFLIGLRVKERVKEYEEKGSQDSSEEPNDPEEPEDPQDDDYDDSGGGFFPEDSGGGFIAEPTVPSADPSEDNEGGFFADDTAPNDSATKPQPPSHTREEVEENWRYENIDLDAGIIITASPHTHPPNTNPSSTKTPHPPPPTTQTISANRHEPNTSPSSSSSLRNLPLPQLELIVKPSTKSTIPAPNPDPDPDPDPEIRTTETPESPPLSPPPPTPSPPPNTHPAEINPQPQPQSQPPTTTIPTLSSQDSEIEKGSLLSEDPEDEDAEPEWLLE